MGIPRAIQAHQQGDLVEAMRHYQRAIDQGDQRPPLFQNYGALLRQHGKHEQALQVYALGLQFNPHDVGVLTNRANLVRDTQPSIALADLLAALRLRLAQGEQPQAYSELFRSAISLCRELGLLAWTLALVRVALLWIGPDPLLLSQLLVLLDGLVADDFEEPPAGGLRSELVGLLEERILCCPPRQQAELRLALAGHDMTRGELDQALVLYEQGLAALRQPGELDPQEAQERQKLLDINSWNFGCGLLKAQELRRGWHLYEHGLRTPAAGPQRWQRALRKPFAASQLPIWRGEPLSGKRILLLEEQAIGDVMMFLTLLPTLQQEAKTVDLMLGERLVPIYRRCLHDSVRIWTHGDALKGRFNATDYDVQCPIGSICQHRFTRLDTYAQRVPMLVAKAARRDELRQAYASAGGSPAQRLIGISWKGGGTAGRIRAKSISPEQFAQLLQPLPGVRFVSLQYGKAAPQVEQWRQAGLDVIHDPRVDALRDMDLWLDQVAACDAVISVANTTIHGAGGLNLPTQCLLSRNCDWRWFTDPAVQRSYWYPSVGIMREDTIHGWSQALQQARQWLEQGCPMPTGPVATRALQPLAAR
jgi:tetratricopeptide (TPR) repeat protein